MTTFSFSIAAQELPDWVFKSENTSGQLIAVGSGSSNSEAKRAAIAEIIAQVSQSVSAESVSVFEKTPAETSQYFKQSVISSTLSIDVNKVTVTKQFVDKASGVNYVQATLSKDEVVRFLQDELTSLATLNFPAQSSAVDKVLWALKYREANNYGLRLERALTGLDAANDTLKNKFRDNLSKVAEVWQRYGVRVIADSSLQHLAGTIDKQLPSATKTVLWLQLKPSHKTRQYQGAYQHKLDLSAELTQPQSPFRVFRQEHISVVGTGASANMARNHALEQLRSILDTPIQNWLFEKGSEL
ncbi:LPP20 family lipoprotein [Idiomarina sp. X4]|uniref:LPP20 family lipoprotein n=1 Tax=Idiomarina sp. X4 TaxID=2055892 RepID=UPI0012FE46B8|nr:LPP20 family lipoprotein [Idiomarina sp. X4]